MFWILSVAAAAETHAVPRFPGFVLRRSSGSIVASPRLVTRCVAGNPVNFRGQVNQMVTRRFAGAAAPTFRWSLVAALLLSGVVSAQDPDPQQADPQSNQVPSSGRPSSGQAPGKPQDATPVYGKIVAEQARLRCWPSEVATPPVFEDVLNKDLIVRLGEQDNGFRAVILPLGPIGYVSKRFTEQADDGSVTTTGSKVAFRYRPRTSEAPVAQLPKGTEVYVIGEEDGWYRARAVGVHAWIANADVQEVASDPENVKAYQAFAAKTKAAPQQRLDEIAAAQKQQELDRIDLEAVRVVEDAFQKELKKPMEQQSYDGLQGALAKVVEGLQKDGTAQTAAASLQKRIETQKWIVEAYDVTQSEPPKADDEPVPEQPKDRLERFEAIGWLRYEGRIAEPGIYYLEKGGRRQYLLSCNTGRFDLALFVGREVGVIGPRRSPLGATLSTLDVERLEVLGTSR
jgi:hypothetical protein